MDNKKVYTPKDLSELTGITLNTVYRYLKAGNIPHIKVGDLYLISEANYQKWINGECKEKVTC